MTLQERCALRQRSGTGEAERACVLGSRFAVRAERRGSRTRRGCEPQHRRLVTGPLGVVSQPREVSGTSW